MSVDQKNFRVFKRQLKNLKEENGKIIRQRIEYESEIRQPLKKAGLSDQEILNNLRYCIEKDYLGTYSSNPDDVDTKLTAKGFDWLNGELESVKVESYAWFYNPYFVGMVVGIASSALVTVIYYFLTANH